MKPETEASLYVGAIATGLAGLLPYVTVFIFPAYVVGAMVAVWHAVTRRGQSLQFKDGAKLGFLSTFLGSMVAVVLVDLFWVFFDYQLWQQQNEQLMLGIFRSFASAATVDTMSAALAENHGKVFRWYLLCFSCSGMPFSAGSSGRSPGC
ncbi:MAG: hypothetical protein ABIO87_07025 [Chthoniobacterales bacterium]